MESTHHPVSLPFTVKGTIVHGDKLGRTIGFPTANMQLSGRVRPPYGVYAVRVRLNDGRVFSGAANFGIRPTIEPAKELFETYIFDFSEDLYGQEIAVELLAFLRPEEKFDSLDSLIQQMREDCVRAREFLASLAQNRRQTIPL